MTNSVLARLAVIISANTAEFTRSLAATRNDLQSFTGGITKLAGTLGVAFSVQQIASFGFELSKLSGKAEAVEGAFERLPNSVQLMKNLKEATGGTVSELELMKRAVQASNFDISLAALPKLLEFATLRAQQTGQSVDYLVDSIVTGIGRKSKLILDNLGISAVQLNEALGGVTTGVASIGEVADAVGKIADDNLSRMEGFAENAATKVQRLSASWDNLKVTIGDLINNSGLPGWLDSVNKGLQDINDEITKGASMTGLQAHIEAFNNLVSVKALDPVERQGRFEDIARMADALGVKLIALEDSAAGLYKILVDPRTKPTWVKATDEEAEKLIVTLDSLKDQEKELQEIFGQTDKTEKRKLENIGAQIIAINKEIEALEKLKRAEKDKDPLAGKFQFLPDIEAEGSTNPELRNEQAANDAKELVKTLDEVAMSAEFAGGAFVNLENASSDAMASVSKDWIDIGPLISGAVIQMADSFGRAAVGAENFGQAVLESLASFAQAFGAAMIATGVAKVAFDSFSGPGMIAAGVALVAAAGALKAVVNNRPNLSNRGGGGLTSRGGFDNSTMFAGANGMQDSSPKLVTVIKGQDLWVMLSNYQKGNIHTRAVG